MRKLFILSALTMFVYAANAQLGVQAGATFYSEKVKFEGGSLNTDTKVGFTAGIVYSAPLSANISFMPSLNFTQKGGKSSSGGSTATETLNYIDLPLNFVYNTNGFFIGAGPAIGIGVSGKDKDDSGSEDVKFGSADDQVKRFEFSANILAGYKFTNGFFITANFNPGISNLSNASDTKAHNSGFGIRLGYFLGAMKKKSSSNQ